MIDTILLFRSTVEGHVKMADSQLFGKNINYSAETLIGYLEMMDFRFGTAINCIDGRTQEPVLDFMKQMYNIDGVDMVTFPGVDGVISN